MSGFCALAIKSTLIPPITTFKREEKGKKWLEGLQENVSKSSLLCLVTFPTLLKALSQCLFWIARHKFVQSQPERIKISCLCCFLNYACWQPVPARQVGCYSGHTGMLMVSLCDIPGLRNIQALVCKKQRKWEKVGRKMQPFLESSQEKLPYPVTLYRSLLLLSYKARISSSAPQTGSFKILWGHTAVFSHQMLGYWLWSHCPLLCWHILLQMGFRKSLMSLKTT